MNDEAHGDLIVAVVNKGYSDELITAAREAGARGGTIINARGMTHEGPVRFFGISVQEEKEIIIILAAREQKLPIMQALSNNFGLNTEAEGFVFSLPVDAVGGFALSGEEAAGTGGDA
ncbi:MAG: hypothetical protein LBQ35_05150 [Spirochaetaceae bacterium]|nr:hypothetical protein [Spirochaetaceae bacterium]